MNRRIAFFRWPIGPSDTVVEMSIFAPPGPMRVEYIEALIANLELVKSCLSPTLEKENV